MEIKSVLWFRHGLRLHDNPALLEAIQDVDDVGNKVNVTFYPIFIFDGESGGTKLVGYNRMKFLIESLMDLDYQLKQKGGPGLYILRGRPVDIFRRLWEELGITKICFEQDCEPIWKQRDDSVKELCQQVGMQFYERISHTLWDPNELIKTNGGFAPLTYQMFLHTTEVMGPPSFPETDDVDFTGVTFGQVEKILGDHLGLFFKPPKPEDFLIYREVKSDANKWVGGERAALKQLEKRLAVEEQAFCNGTYLPNQANPELMSPSTALSAALRYGCLSVRKFFYSIHNLHSALRKNGLSKLPTGNHIAGQLIWREYFYTMSINNINYDKIKGNPICLDISWNVPNEDDIARWKKGNTGIPIVDAAMRQLMEEGWIHHTLRNLVASFLTRSGLWASWEIGNQHFMKYLLDADWSVCAGNWMWVSSSAFESLLDSSDFSLIPVAQRLDPNGNYVRKYVPELKDFPTKFIQQPWTANLKIQKDSNCIIGENYPSPIIDLDHASYINANRMKAIRASLKDIKEDHVRPSNEQEIRTFFWIADELLIPVN